jgi:SWI/SNF-related matrix-associated actin-dependent regulator 1 of chromatin subfamily A
MTDPHTHVFVGNIKVAGVGLTLTTSYEIDMLESDWSPAGNAQAIKRVHRYGQQQAVHARFITLANSIDVAVNRIVRDKTASIAQIEGHTMTASPLTV